MNADLRRIDSRLPTFWTVQLVGWFCFYVSAVVTALPELRSGALWGSSEFAIATFAASCGMRPICRSLMKRPLSWVALELWAFIWCVPAGVLTAFVVEFVTYRHLPNWVEWLETSVQSGFILFVWCSLYFSIKLWQQSVRERERLLRAESDVRDARLRALRYQLNPHFLFNSLNAVSTLVLEGNPPAATRMLTQIADFLRAILDYDPLPQAPLAREIAFTQQYLAIEQTRLGNRLRVELALAPQTLDALVPSMLLQPLVENAVRHGVAPLVEGGSIAITSEISGTRLTITVRNSAPPTGSASQSAGIGLSNTHERLRTLYGNDYSLVLRCADSGECEARAELPLCVR